LRKHLWEFSSVLLCCGIITAAYRPKEPSSVCILLALPWILTSLIIAAKMMKSIALNDSVHHDDEGFVIVGAEFDSSLLLLNDDDICSAGGDEDSYDHCEDAFSFSSLHQTLPASSLLPTVQDNFFDPPPGQEVEFLLPPAIPLSPSLLSEVAELDLAEREDVLSCSIDVVLYEPSDLEGTQEPVLSPLKTPQEDDTVQEDEENTAPAAVVMGDSLGPEPSMPENPIVPEIPPITSDTPDEARFASSEEEGGCTTTSSSSSSHQVAARSDDGEALGSTDDGEDEVESSGSDGKWDDDTVVTSRLSKKKRSKQLRLAKKAAAAAAAAAALGQFTLRSPTKRKLRSKGRSKKVANIAVSCAVQSLADYKDEVERSSKLAAKKALR
jgi:hypothetical protein